MYPYHYHWWYLGWWAFWIAVIIFIILVLRSVGGPGPRGGEPRETPEEILKRRYAKGEIEKEEFESKLNDLRR